MQMPIEFLTHLLSNLLHRYIVHNGRAFWPYHFFMLNNLGFLKVYAQCLKNMHFYRGRGLESQLFSTYNLIN